MSQALNQVEAVNMNQGLKNFIIGKLWVKSTSGNRPGSIKISRSLPKDILLKPGTTLFLNENKKREGKADADYNVSVLFQSEVADAMIASEKAINDKMKQDRAQSESSFPPFQA